MTTYILRRLIILPPTLIFVSLMVFLLLRVVPGNAIDVMIARMDTVLTNEQRAAFERELGLDSPIYVQYARWLGGMLRFDYGHSLQQRNRQISTIIITAGIRSGQMMILAILFGVTMGIVFGVVSGVWSNTWIDSLIRVLSTLGLAMPSFLVAVLLYYYLIKYFNWIPPLRFVNLWDSPLESLGKLIWPVLVMSLTISAPITRLTRSQFLEVYREDYIRTARAKGLEERTIILRHALRNALLPIVTVAGSLFPRLIAGVVVIEAVYGIPGMGTALVEAITSRDYPVIQALLWNTSLAVMVVNLIVDVTYGWIDPRIRYS